MRPISLITLLTIFLFSCGDNKTDQEKVGESAIDSGVFIINSIDTDSDDKQFEPLRDIVGDASMVALGESVHTSGGYYQAKLRLFKWLVENKNFRAFAFETPWYEAKVTGQYVETCEGTAYSALRGIFGVWNDESTEELLQWMCQWNQDHPNDKVYFYGWDAQNPWEDIKIIKRVIEDTTQNSQVLTDELSVCNGNKPGYTPEYSSQDYESCLIAIDVLDGWFEDNGSTLSYEDHTLMKISLIAYRAWQGAIYYGSFDDQVMSYESRDIANAEIIDILRERVYPNIKTVIWAHNAHIAERQQDITGHGESKTQYLSFQGWQSTGTILKETHGEDYKSIALTGYDVNIRWSDFKDPDIPTNENAVEVMLKESFGEDFILVNLHKTEIFDKNKQYQMSLEWMYLDVQYDAIFYLENSWARIVR